MRAPKNQMEREAPYVIAELSANHAGSLDQAFELVDLAARSGADAIKLQTFTPDSLTVDSRAENFRIPPYGSPWDGQILWDLFSEAQTPYDWHKPIFDRAREKGLACMSSAFDEKSADFLVSLGVDAIKIASFELVNLSLIGYVASSGTQMLLSTGMATRAEVIEAVDTVVANGGQLAGIFKCTSAYPAPRSELNLAAISSLRQMFQCPIGFSDHTLGSGAAMVAVGLGASIFERHLAVSRDSASLDASFSSDANDFHGYIEDIKSAHSALGSDSLHPVPSERASLWERPSVLALEDIEEGQILTTLNVGIRRPGHGSHPRDYPRILGARAKRRVSRGDGLSLSDVEIP